MTTSLEEFRNYMKSKDLDFYKDPREERDVLPTGFHVLDDLSNGGVRAGTFVEFYGDPGTGKTYLALNLMRQCQEIWEKPVMYVDFEKSWDPGRAQELGVDIDPEWCDVVTPPNQEQGYDYVHAAVKSNLFGVIVIDSMAAMAPIEEIDEEMNKNQVAKGARVNSKAMRVLTSAMQDTVVVFINQMRTNIGVMYGDPNTTSGGKAKDFYAHMRFGLTKLTTEKVKKKVYNAKKGNFEEKELYPGHIIKILFKKSRMGNETKYCELVYNYDIAGVDRIEDLKAHLFNKGKITRNGAFYQVGDSEKIKGKNALYKFLQDNEEYVTKLARE